MRPKTKNTNIFHAQTTKNTKNKTTKKKKQTTTIIIVAIFIAFASTIQFSHNTPPHTQHPTKGLAYQGWSIEQHSCCSRHPTACHKTKQTRTQTHLLLCKTLYNQQGLKDRKKFLFHQLPKPHTWNACGSFPPEKPCHHFAPKPDTKQWQKLATSQALTSTHTVTKQILYSP